MKSSYTAGPYVCEHCGKTEDGMPEEFRFVCFQHDDLLKLNCTVCPKCNGRT